MKPATVSTPTEKKPLRVGIPGKTYTVPVKVEPKARRHPVVVLEERLAQAERKADKIVAERIERFGALASHGGDEDWQSALVEDAELQETRWKAGLVFDNKRKTWVCRYRCTGGLTNVNGVFTHDHSCGFWTDTLPF